MIGAFSAGLNHGIGDITGGMAEAATSSTDRMAAGLASIALHGIRGGIVAELQGGKFGSGFVSAGLTETFSPVAGTLSDSPFARAIVMGVIGGTISELSGDKFANGAGSAVFAELFNHLSSGFLRRNNYEHLGDGFYARVDTGNIEGGVAFPEVHVYKYGAKLREAIESQKSESLEKFERGIWSLDPVSETYGWSKKHEGKVPHLTAEQMNRLNGVVVNHLRGIGMLAPKGKAPNGNPNWERGAKWIRGPIRVLGPAGIIFEASKPSVQRICDLNPNDLSC